jgi:phosphoglycerate dehydrogenase-like enzyme
MSLMLASLNHVPAWVHSQRQATWSDPGPRAGLSGKTVVVVGYGAVGRALATMLTGFEVAVVPVARRARPGVAAIDELPGLLPMADVLVVAAPLTPATRGLIGQEALVRLPQGALLVNVSRGGLVDTAALLEHARSGRIRAALDVTDPEPLPDGHPLWECPGVLISPHVGGDMADFQQRAVSFVSEQLCRYEQGLPLRNIVAGPVG